MVCLSIPFQEFSPESKTIFPLFSSYGVFLTMSFQDVLCKTLSMYFLLVYTQHHVCLFQDALNKNVNVPLFAALNQIPLNNMDTQFSRYRDKLSASSACAVTAYALAFQHEFQILDYIDHMSMFHMELYDHAISSDVQELLHSSDSLFLNHMHIVSNKIFQSHKNGHDLFHMSHMVYLHT